MGIEKSMFISPNSLHLTVVMLKLENKEAVDAAQDILKVTISFLLVKRYCMHLLMIGLMIEILYFRKI